MRERSRQSSALAIRIAAIHRSVQLVHLVGNTLSTATKRWQSTSHGTGEAGTYLRVAGAPERSPAQRLQTRCVHDADAMRMRSLRSY